MGWTSGFPEITKRSSAHWDAMNCRSTEFSFMHYVWSAKWVFFFPMDETVMPFFLSFFQKISYKNIYIDSLLNVVKYCTGTFKLMALFENILRPSNCTAQLKHESEDH